jgi:hypothetical protein
MRGCPKAYVWRAELASAKGNNDIDVECSNGFARSEDLVEENERDAQQSEHYPRQLTDQVFLAHDANAQSDGQQ